MSTERSTALFEFASVDNRRVVAGFDGGAITSHAGALLLGATDRAIGLIRRFAECFRDARSPERVKHEVATLCVWSRALMVHSSHWNGRRRYGPSSPWERPHDGVSASSDTA
jgi:hypothetical protein